MGLFDREYMRQSNERTESRQGRAERRPPTTILSQTRGEALETVGKFAGMALCAWLAYTWIPTLSSSVFDATLEAESYSWNTVGGEIRGAGGLVVSSTTIARFWARLSWLLRWGVLIGCFICSVISLASLATCIHVSQDG